MFRLGDEQLASHRCARPCPPGLATTSCAGDWPWRTPSPSSTRTRSPLWELYIARHPGDHEALLVTVHAIYAARVEGRPLLGGNQDRERMVTYARAYAAAKGPHEALVGWLVGGVRRQP